MQSKHIKRAWNSIRQMAHVKLDCVMLRLHWRVRQVPFPLPQQPGCKAPALAISHAWTVAQATCVCGYGLMNETAFFACSVFSHCHHSPVQSDLQPTSLQDMSRERHTHACLCLRLCSLMQGEQTQCLDPSS